MLEDGPELIAEIQEQEKRLVFDRFSNADAWDLGCLLVELATERSHPVTIDITRSGQQLFHAALAGTALDNDEWVARKIRTVQRFGTSSLLVGVSARVSGRAFEDAPWNDVSVYAAHGGSFPITIRDTGVIGSVTVSGLPQLADHQLVVEAIERFLAG